MRKPAPPGAAATQERILAIQAVDAPDLLARLSVLVSRRGGALSSAIGVRDPRVGRRTLAVVVSGAPRVVSRLPLWIGGLPDVLEVQDLTPRAFPTDARDAAGGGAVARTTHSKEGIEPC